MGIYDQPAFIDHILQHTGAIKLAAYVGHSQGTTQMFIGSSLKPMYFESKIELFVALAPVVRMNNITDSSLVTMGKINPSYLQSIILLLHTYNLMPRTPVSGYYG